MKKLKVVAISGTPRTDDLSITNLVLRKTHASFCRYFKNIEWEILKLRDLKIDVCKGCLRCFNQGGCIIDDDMNLIKNKMISSDIIILASPVFFHNVTGVFKTFMDRTSFYSHYFGMIGKYGITYSISSTNGNDEVNKYLKKYLDFLGVRTTAQISILEKLDSSDIIDYKIDFAVECLKREIESKNMNDSEFQEEIFQYFNKIYNAMKDSNFNSFECETRMSKIGMKFNSFSEAFEFYSKNISVDC